jgi:hypothetical protein
MAVRAAWLGLRLALLLRGLLLRGLLLRLRMMAGTSRLLLGLRRWLAGRVTFR